MRAELQPLLAVINSLFGVVIVHVFLVFFLGERYKQKIIYFLVLLSYFSINLFLSLYMNEPMWLSLSLFIFCFTYSIALFSGTFLQRCFGSGLIIAYSIITETLSVFFISWMFDYSFSTVTTVENLYFLTAFIAKVLMFTAVLSITKLKRTNLLHAPIKKIFPLFVVVLLCTFFSIVSGSQALEVATSVTLPMLLAEGAIFALSLLVFYIYKSLVSLTEKEVHNELLKQQIALDSLQFQRLDNYVHDIRSIKHDFTHHLTSMRALIDEKNYEELDHYFHRYLHEIQPVLSEIVTGLPSVDAVISTKKNYAINSGINFCVSVLNISSIDINPVHLNVILANTLDNAIEACLDYKGDTPRKIELKLMMDKEYLYFEIINTSNPISFKEGTLPKTTKEDKIHHGLGLESTERLVLSYEGVLQCEYGEGQFFLRSRLKNTKSANTDRFSSFLS